MAISGVDHPNTDTDDATDPRLPDDSFWFHDVPWLASSEGQSFAFGVGVERSADPVGSVDLAWQTGDALSDALDVANAPNYSEGPAKPAITVAESPLQARDGMADTANSVVLPELSKPASAGSGDGEPAREGEQVPNTVLAGRSLETAATAANPSPLPSDVVVADGTVMATGTMSSGVESSVAADALVVLLPEITAASTQIASHAATDPSQQIDQEVLFFSSTGESDPLPLSIDGEINPLFLTAWPGYAVDGPDGPDPVQVDETRHVMALQQVLPLFVAAQPPSENAMSIDSFVFLPAVARESAISDGSMIDEMLQAIEFCPGDIAQNVGCIGQTLGIAVRDLSVIPEDGNAASDYNAPAQMTITIDTVLPS